MISGCCAPRPHRGRLRPQEAAEALAVVRDWTEKAGLTLHPVKTRLVDARSDGFDFLGYHFERGRRWPRQKSLGKLKARSRAKTGRAGGRGLPRVIGDTTPIRKGGSDTSGTVTG